MTYKKTLIEKIKDGSKWPAFERADFLDELDNIAYQAFTRNTIEGYLASLLIYQQLSEEIIRQLLQDAQFFIQLSVFPAEMYFDEKPRLTLGQVIDELKATISFQNKAEIINACRELNSHRNELIHRLTKRTSVADIETQIRQVKNLYDEIFSLSRQAHDTFTISFKDFRRDVDWDEYLDE